MEMQSDIVLLEDNDKLALIDTGIGLLETKNPETRIGQNLIGRVGFKFNEIKQQSDKLKS